ncbi:MAG: hypothetical protein JSW66_01525 [Phycisphaerales bacterium]|nr:MAG: hypothetical protein JSW66_01525 [Phycisphaerales bacterium]
MSETSILLKAYYEALYERLEACKELLARRIDDLLAAEVAARGFDDFDDEKYAAYREACLAFVEERIEAYNPIGIQYLYDRERAKSAFELELQLDWYDSRAEFAALVQAARDKAEPKVTPERLRGLAQELMRQAGAFPDKSIISAYEAKPGLKKLPDYIVARTIEEIIV